jgi:hypothetical protein
MNHLCAFYKSIDSATLVALDTVVDDILTRPSPDRFQVPTDLSAIAWAIALGTDLTRAQLVSPSIEVRRMSLDIIPQSRGQLYLTLEAIRAFVPKSDLLLTPTENFMVYASEDGYGATDVAALVSLKAPGALPAMPAGDIRVIRATAAQTLTPYQWTTFTPTYEKDLEPGTYQLVGFIPSSANVIAARALFMGQGYRPGVPGVAGSVEDALNFGADWFDKVMWYAMGQFTHISPPQFQFLASEADSAETIILFVVKTG